MSELILVTKEQRIATITLNRPDKRNAMNGNMIQALLQTLQHLQSDHDIRVLIIKGAGEHFCAGADITWMQTVSSGSYEKNYDDAQALSDLMFQLYTFPRPTIVLAHGAIMGGGLGLLAACDIALVSQNAVFSFSEVKIGITPSTISPYVLAAIGERAAHYYFLTGEKFDAQDAHRIGLAHRVIEDSLLLQKGQEIAEQLLKNSPNALMAAKQLIRSVAHEKISDKLAQKTAEHLSNLRSSNEAQEGLRAFMEKRLPSWS